MVNMALDRIQHHDIYTRIRKGKKILEEKNY